MRGMEASKSMPPGTHCLALKLLGQSCYLCSKVLAQQTGWDIDDAVMSRVLPRGNMSMTEISVLLIHSWTAHPLISAAGRD